MGNFVEQKPVDASTMSPSNVRKQHEGRVEVSPVFMRIINVQFMEVLHILHIAPQG